MGDIKAGVNLVRYTRPETPQLILKGTGAVAWATHVLIAYRANPANGAWQNCQPGNLNNFDGFTSIVDGGTYYIHIKAGVATFDVPGMNQAVGVDLSALEALLAGVGPAVAALEARVLELENAEPDGALITQESETFAPNANKQFTLVHTPVRVLSVDLIGPNATLWDAVYSISGSIITITDTDSAYVAATFGARITYERAGVNYQAPGADAVVTAGSTNVVQSGAVHAALAMLMRRYRTALPYDFTWPGGTTYGTPAAPLNGNISLVGTDAINDTIITIYHQAATEPIITGGTIRKRLGSYKANEVNEIWIHREVGGTYFVNTPNVAEATTPPTTPGVTLSSIALIANPASINEGGAGSTLTVQATYSNGATANVAALLSKASGPGILSNGVLTVAPDTITANGTAVINASYTEGGITLNATVNIAVLNTDPGQTQLATVTGFNASSTEKTSIDLIWNAPPGATGYNIYEREPGGSFSLRTTVGAVTSYKRTGLSSGDTREFEIEAIAAGFNPSNKATTSARTVTDFDGLGNLKAILDYRGLVANTTNRYGQVDASGNVLKWRGVAPGPTTVEFDRVGSGITLTPEGVSFNGLGNFTNTVKSLWKYLHYASTNINDLKSTTHFVIKLGSVANPDAFYGLMGTNGTSGNNPGASIYWDDRSTTPANNRIKSMVSGQAVKLAENDTNESVVPNTFLVLTIEVNGAFTGADRMKIYVNGVNQNLPSGITQSNVMQNNDPFYNMDIGSAGNGAGRLNGVIKQVALQGLIESEASRNAFINKMVAEKDTVI